MAITPAKSKRRSVQTPAKPSLRDELSGLKDRLLRPGKKVKSNEVIFFTSQLALMLEIGTSLSNALGALGQQIKNVSFKSVIGNILREVEEGRPLSYALGKYPRIFDSIYLSLIKAGETGGFLSKILNRLVDIQEKRKAFVSHLRSTLTYPVILCLTAGGVIVFVLVAILPRFMVIFQGKEALLPMSTTILMGLSVFLRGYWWLCLLLLGVAFICLKLYLSSPAGKRHTDLFLIKAPLLCRLSNKIFTNQFLRTMGSLLESRVSLLEALDVTKGALGNSYYRDMVDDINEHVQAGGDFSSKIQANPYLLESVKQMLVTAEESGTLALVMLKLADYYDSEIERDLKTVSSLIEPFALVVIGGVVGLIVASVILPLFKVANAVG